MDIRDIITAMMINYKCLALFFVLFCMTQLFGSFELKPREVLRIKKISIERIERLVKHYSSYVFRKRCAHGMQGGLKIGGIFLVVAGINWLTQKSETNQVEQEKKSKQSRLRRVSDNVLIAALVAFFMTGIDSSIFNFSKLFGGSLGTDAVESMLYRFLYALKQYKLVIASLKGDAPFISEYAIIIAYNRIIIALEHLIAWKKVHIIETDKKVIFDSLDTFLYALEEYEVLLSEAREQGWTSEARLKLISYTHSFLYPWLTILTPEIMYE